MNGYYYSAYVAHAMQVLAQEAGAVGATLMRPSAVWKPRVFIDGTQWCALYGENLQDGVAGFGDSPDAAMRDFDRNWHAPLKAQAGDGNAKGGA